MNRIRPRIRARTESRTQTLMHRALTRSSLTRNVLARGIPTRSTLTSALISLLGGALAGTVFWALHARSPAPPWLGLTGLLGIVLGERAVLGLRDRHRADRHHASRRAAQPTAQRTESPEGINPSSPEKA